MKHLTTNCPHDHLLVEDNGSKETCQKCGAIMKYVEDPYDYSYSREANEEWCQWLGPHFNQKRVVDWEKTRKKFGLRKDTTLVKPKPSTKLETTILRWLAAKLGILKEYDELKRKLP